MLSFAEETVLVALDEATGELTGTTQATLSAAIAGAVLMELALADRVDSDTRDIWVVSAEPTGNPLLDAVLAKLGAPGEHKPMQQVVRGLMRAGHDLKEQALERLVARGILRREESRLLWIFGSKAYPTVDGTQREEVRTRLRRIVLSDRFPDARDAALVGLVQSCHLFAGLLSIEELALARPRIAALAKLDLIGQQVTRIIRGVEEELALAFGHVG